MSAPLGNEFWKARSTHGRNPKFESPEQLETACEEYFQWAHDNPLWEDNLVTFQGSAKHEPTAKMRAMTLDGLHLFLDIHHDTWAEYRKREDLSAVVTRVEKAIRSQKFAGAAADLLNANIIARDLGLSDKTDTTHNVSDGVLELLNAVSGKTRSI
ncbi:MAG: DNA-packaging protein [Aestuariivirga sp.]|nr:DNA-packaging protein [Aestuariivirga sp.]